MTSEPHISTDPLSTSSTSEAVFGKVEGRIFHFRPWVGFLQPGFDDSLCWLLGTEGFPLPFRGILFCKRAEGKDSLSLFSAIMIAYFYAQTIRPSSVSLSSPSSLSALTGESCSWLLSHLPWPASPEGPPRPPTYALPSPPHWPLQPAWLSLGHTVCWNSRIPLSSWSRCLPTGREEFSALTEHCMVVYKILVGSRPESLRPWPFDSLFTIAFFFKVQISFWEAHSFISWSV